MSDDRTKSGARLHTETTRCMSNPGFFRGGKIHPYKKFWAKINAKQDAELKCACGNTALFKVLGKKLIGYCRKCKPKAGIA